MKMNEPVASNEAEMAWAFPSVDPGAKPLGGRVMVQIRRSKKKTTKAGILLVEETKETEKWNTQVAKVIEIGPLAFCHRDTMQQWPEGSWCKVGDFILARPNSGTRLKIHGREFRIINDDSVEGVVQDPRGITRV